MPAMETTKSIMDIMMNICTMNTMITIKQLPPKDFLVVKHVNETATTTTDETSNVPLDVPLMLDMEEEPQPSIKLLLQERDVLIKSK
jgi:hypothetical protein